MQSQTDTTIWRSGGRSLLNYVLVKPDKDHTKDYKTGMYISDHYDPARHWSVSGTVIQIPQRLVYLGDELQALKSLGKLTGAYLHYAQQHRMMSMDFDTEIEVQVGDKVYFNYSNHIAGSEEKKEFNSPTGEKLILMPYDSLYVAVRGDECIPLNGYIYVKPLRYSIEDLQNMRKTAHGWKKPPKKGDIRKGWGVVEMVGSPNKGYLDYPDAIDSTDIRAGQTVLFRKTLSFDMEWSYHKTLFQDTIYRMQRKDILAYY